MPVLSNHFQLLPTFFRFISSGSDMPVKPLAELGPTDAHSPLQVLTLKLNSGMSEHFSWKLLILPSAAVAGFALWHSGHHTEAPAADIVKPAGQGWLAGFSHSSVWIQSGRLGCFACCFTLQVSLDAAALILSIHMMCSHTQQKAPHAVA